MSGATFTLAEAMAAQRAMRDALGLAEESFPPPALIGMLSDEIEKMQACGRDDAAIARLIARTTGKPVDTDDIGRYRAEPDERAHG